MSFQDLPGKQWSSDQMSEMQQSVMWSLAALCGLTRISWLAKKLFRKVNRRYIFWGTVNNIELRISISAQWHAIILYNNGRNAQCTKEGHNRRNKQLQEKVISGGDRDSYTRQRKCMTFNRWTISMNKDQEYKWEESYQQKNKQRCRNRHPQ